MADVRDGRSQVQGDIAHDAADAGNPLKLGGKAASSAPADVAAGDRVDAYFDLKGRQVVLADARDGSGNALGSTTDTIDTGSAADGMRRLATQSTLVGYDPDGPAARYLRCTGAGVLHVDVRGSTEHDDADAGNGGPVKVGGMAHSAAPSAVAAGDRVNGYFDLQGRLVVAAKAATATLSNVNDSASSVTLLAANTARLGASVFNDSTSTLYLKLGTTASTTSYTAQLQPYDLYEVPGGYTGVIDGIWSADASGAARVTELT
jgi:hypothetical protein